MYHIQFYQSFTNAQSGTHEYMVRAAILKEFEAVAENLHFSQADPIRQTHTAFWSIEKQMYGMRDIIAHKYGVTHVDYKIIWGALNPGGILVKTVLPVIEEMIKENGVQ